MILGAISYLDCAVFVLLLIPQLFIHISLLELTRAGIDILPFFLFNLPFGLLNDRYWTPRLRQPPFVQHATLFQDLVIRCVRYAFARLPSSIGRIFFSKAVALPFMRWRMLRHGILYSPVHWYEVKTGNTRGLWITGKDDSKIPDVVVYYIHGGGFAMGSAYFYLEPLIALRDLLLSHYRNPAVFALEYELVPDAAYPKQIDETIEGYEYVLKRLQGNAERVVVAGDSAGGTLTLSMLLQLAKSNTGRDLSKKPGYAALISPWTNLVSEKHRNTASDYLNDNSLHVYGSQYAGRKELIAEPLVSPGNCTSASWWKDASPVHGLYITYGSEEVLGPDVKDLIKRWRKAEMSVTVNEEPGGIHAWVIARLFLEEGMDQRAKGMLGLVNAIRANIKAK